MATTSSPALTTPTPPPNPKYHGLLRRLHRGQPRCRGLRGATGQPPSLLPRRPTSLPSSSSANGPGPPDTCAWDGVCGASRIPRIERGIGFPHGLSLGEGRHRVHRLLMGSGPSFEEVLSQWNGTGRLVQTDQRPAIDSSWDTRAPCVEALLMHPIALVVSPSHYIRRTMATQ
jgi:hypothetical protein